MAEFVDEDGNKAGEDERQTSRMADGEFALSAPPMMARVIQKKGWTRTGMPKMEKRTMCRAW
jgi:hypothetical protein